MRTLTVYKKGAFRNDVPLAAISDLLDAPDVVMWLDIQDPTDEDTLLLADEFGFHPLAIEDAVRSHERPKVDAYEHDILTPLHGYDGRELLAESDEPAEMSGHQRYYFVVFYEAAFDTSHDHINTEAINIFIGRNYIVTVHQGDTRHVTETLTRWQAPNSPLANKVGGLVYAFLDSIVDDYFPLMDQVADRVEELEDTIFEHFQEESIQRLFRLKKDLLSMRRIVAPERDVLNVLLRRDIPIFQDTDIAYLQDVYDHIVRLTDNIDTYRDLLSSAVDSYLSLQSNNLNQIVKVLTIASIVLMADSLIAGIYGMNFIHMPELRWQFGHLWAIFLMVIITAALIIFFRRKRWL